MMINCEISVFQNRENGEMNGKNGWKMALKSAFSVFQNREKVKENGFFSVFRKNEENGNFSVFQNRENGEISFHQKTENGFKKGNFISPFSKAVCAGLHKK